MEPDQVHQAMAEMQRFMREQLGDREFDALSAAEIGTIHDAADAHILSLYGVRGWDVAALAAAALPTESGSDDDFEVWKQLYAELEELGEREGFPCYFVYGDYAGDRTAVVNCTEEAETRVAQAIHSVLDRVPAYRAFAVHLVPTTSDCERNASRGRTLRFEGRTA